MDFDLDELSMFTYTDKSVLKSIGIMIKYGSHAHVFEFGYWKTFDSLASFFKHFKDNMLIQSGLIHEQYNTKVDDAMGIKNIERLNLIMTCSAPREEFDRLVNVLARYPYGKFDLFSNNSRHFIVKAAAVTQGFGYSIDENALFKNVVDVTHDQDVQKAEKIISIVVSAGIASFVPVYNALRFPLGFVTLITLITGFQQADDAVKVRILEKYNVLFSDTLNCVKALRN
eukprot:NODE_169_length_16247_cov_0.185348.p9 type:complete len:228 gc:universal NODE_169_length_16247_cov_0.185348:3502-4185(+)